MRVVRLACAAAAFLALAQSTMSEISPTPRRDINAVLADHDDRLLAIPGVVGVYVGLLEDGKTACLKVMLAERNEATERAIPKKIEGFPVVTEVTGELRPLGK
jgi:hypothetical protein